MAAPADAEEYSFDYFKQWNKDCRVRKIQEKIEEVSQKAKDAKKTIDQQLTEDGYKGHSDFARQCPQFDLTCNPMEFKELGSGFVLYFQFIGFMMFLLLLVVLITSPAVAIYAGEDWGEGWYWTKWEDGWSDNSDACNCKGSNPTGIVGPGGPSYASADYGLTCGAWDRQACVDRLAGQLVNGQPVPIKDVAQWCCSSWCFADPTCPTPDDEDMPAALWNRHYKGLVRSTSPCQQDLSACQNYVQNAFNEEGVETAAYSFIGKMWLTPGNFGPDQAEQKWIPFLWLAIVCGISFMTIVMHQYQIYVDSEVDAGTTSPNDFAVMVKGLPRTATDEAAIAEFFKEHAVKGKTDTEIVKVVIGWDVKEYNAVKKKMQELNAKLKDHEVNTPEYDEIKKEIVKLQADLVACAPDRAARLMSSGVVVIVFRKQSDLRACLQRWTSFWAKWFYSDGEDLSFLPRGNMLCKGAALPKFPVGDPPMPINTLQVERAANPGDIHWEELGKTNEETAKLFMQTNAIMFVLIVVCIACTYGLNKWQEQVAEDQEDDGSMGTRFVSAIPGLGVSIVNCILMVASRRLGDKEYHETWTGQEFSQAAKMTVALLFNTAGVMLFANIKPKEWFMAGGLIDDAIMVLIFDAIIPPLMFYQDLKYKIKGLARRKLTQEKIDSWNAIMKQPLTKETVQAKQTTKREVEAFKKQFEPSELDYPRRYANAMNTFLCTLFFSPVFPIAPVIGMVGLMVQYWMDKYLLIRWYKRPTRPYNARLAMWSLKFIRFTCPLFVSVFAFFFLSPMFKEKADVLTPFLLSLCVAAGMIILPTTILRTILCLRCFMAAKGIDVGDADDDYYTAQYMWSKEMKYHKDHFLYARLPEKLNPEFLSQGTTYVTKIDDVKGSYGAATAEGSEKEEGVRVKGLKLGVHGAKTEDGEDAVVDAATGGKTYGIKPVTFGVTAPTDEPEPTPKPEPIVDTPTPVAPVAAPDAVKDEPLEPTAVPIPAAETDDAPKADAPKTEYTPKPHKPAGKIVWEFEYKGRWCAYKDDCQGYLEKKYQEFVADGKGKGKGKGFIHVKTDGKELSIDFKKMSSKMKDSHHTNDIRRREA